MTTFAIRSTWDGLEAARRDELVHRHRSVPDDVRSTVADIERRIIADGDDALRSLAAELDGATIDDVLVPPERIEAAWDQLDPTVQSALEAAKESLSRYHRASLPPAGRVDDAVGLSCTWRFDPLDRAGIYVPGGRNPYPSTLLMAAVPASIADVPDIWVATPPGPGGDPHPAILGAAHLMGIDRVVRAGGAQAIFALAHGTDSVAPCNVVVGPGNSYVQAAKRSIAGTCRIDSPAGPSEVLVLADENARPGRIAAELLAQAEHGPDAFCAAVVPTDAIADAVEQQVTKRAGGLATGDVALEALANAGALLVEPDVDAQVAAANDLAPEHLIVLREDAATIEPRLRNAGCVFIGPHASVPLGDYVAGPSHILPTSGTARSYAGVGTDTFLRRTNIVASHRPAPPRLINATQTLAELEGLPGHRDAMEEAAHRG